MFRRALHIQATFLYIRLWRFSSVRLIRARQRQVGEKQRRRSLLLGYQSVQVARQGVAVA